MANISETQLQAFRTLQRFSDFAANHGEKAVARLDGHDGAPLTASTTDRAYKCFRSEVDKQQNDRVRDTLKRALCEMFGQQNEFQLENLPASVKANLKISDFGENGGHPLLGRRITAIMNAVKASATWASVKSEYNERESHAMRVQMTINEVREDADHIFGDVKAVYSFDKALTTMLGSEDSAFRRALNRDLTDKEISNLVNSLMMACNNNIGSYNSADVLIGPLADAFNAIIPPNKPGKGAPLESVHQAEIRQAAIDTFLRSLANAVERLSTVKEVAAKQNQLEETVFSVFKLQVSDVRKPFTDDLDLVKPMWKEPLLENIRNLRFGSIAFRMLQTANMPGIDDESVDRLFNKIASYIDRQAVVDEDFNPEDDGTAQNAFGPTAENIRNGVRKLIERFLTRHNLVDDNAANVRSFMFTLGEVISRATVDLIVYSAYNGFSLTCDDWSEGDDLDESAIDRQNNLQRGDVTEEDVDDVSNQSFESEFDGED